ncbi:ComEA family DNA-binding protein [Halomonas elongata]|uniref:ComEA family DNA-binding protein n=1 Tax=Halomonas elongata TaxID=2746 RepID=UPI00186B9A5C|nr:helix-hairpin-helix domain-containing protein [Halomonas elongata]MBW5801772.1 helix-hairpin-helix domain-containing protein [Halomonas elongata]
MPTDIKGLTAGLGLALLLGIAQPVLAEDTTDASTADSTENMAQIAPIDINTADAALLAELPGIGDVKATAIVEERDANGPFENADDLTRVKGIGSATVEALADEVTH